MLKLKYMFENFQLAKQALWHWEHNADNLDKYLRYFRISSNAIYPFESNNKRCFLRLSPAEEKQEINLKGELEFLQYLNVNNYPAMKPIPSKEGELLVLLDTEWGRYYVSAFEGVAGESIEDTDYQSNIMFAYGKALGRLHNLSMEYEAECKKWTYEDALSKLLVTKDSFGLVHYDFEPDNVFYDALSGECHVIDFEDGMYHFFLVDIDQVFDALAEELEDKALCIAKSWFIKGYQSERDIDENYEEKLPLMRRFCNIYSYARLIRCVSDNISDEPEWMSNLRGILERKIKHLEYCIECKNHI